MPETTTRTCCICADPIDPYATICDDCVADHVQCYDCGEWVPELSTHTVRAREICNSCLDHNYSTCIHCSDTVRNHYMYQDYCDDCRNNLNLDTCENCGDLRDLNEEGYCDDCDRPNHRLIHDYSYRPLAEYHGDGPLYYGVELEVNTSDDTAETVLSMLGGDEHVYLKRDSSIGEGYEIVTHPHNWSEICNLWGRWTAPRGVTSYQSGKCGMHVHVSRKALTAMQVQKLVVFLNAPENHSFIERIAQRDVSRWAAIKHDKQFGHCGHSNDRYEALNLTNTRTIEFRIFRGSTRKERILKNLEFVAASIAWTRNASYRELSHAKFIAYVEVNRKSYPNLHKFIQETATCA